MSDSAADASDADQGAEDKNKPAATPAATATTANPTPVVVPTAATTQQSAISPLQTDEAKARLEARKRLGRTAIGIAPPAAGSKGPPTASEEKKFKNDEPPTKPQTLAFGAEPPTKPGQDGAAKLEDEISFVEVTPSKPPPVPTKPPTASRPPPPVAPIAKSQPPPPPVSISTSKDSPPSAFTETLVAAAPPPTIKDGTDHPLAATQKSEGFKDPPPPAPMATGASSAKRSEKLGGRTLIGTAPPAILNNPPPLGTLAGFPNPPAIVPRRRTPAKGIPAATPTTPASAATPPVPTPSTPTVTVEGVESTSLSPSEVPAVIANNAAIPKITPAAGAPPGAFPNPVVTEKERESKPPPPIIRIPQGGMLGSSTAVRDSQGTLICEILLKNGAVTQENVDKALLLQEERGGQIGRILVSIGACTEEAIAKALIEQLRLRKDGGHFMSDISAAARERKDVVGLKVLTRPTRTVITLLVTDLFSLLLAALIATSVHWFRIWSEMPTLDWTAWLVVGPSIALCMLTFLGVELYSPMAKSTPDEIRDITFAASLVHLGASVLSTLGDLPIVKWGVFVRGVWWAATLFLVPVIRSLVRGYLSVQPWWGIPVCVLGAAKTGRLVVRTLKAQPRSGLKPVMLLDDDINKYGTLRASFTNEKMDVYSVNVSAAHFLTAEQRAELASDIFGDDRSSSRDEQGERNEVERGGDAASSLRHVHRWKGDEEAERASQPISSDHIPVAPQVRVEVKDGVTTTEPGAGPSAPTEKKLPAAGAAGVGGGAIPPDRQSSEEFFNPDSQRISRSGITKDASQFPRGKFAEVDGVPLVGDLSLAPVLATRLNIPYAVIAMPGVDSAKLLQIVERIGGRFTHMLIIPDLFGFATMGVPAKSLGGILGVEVRQQLLLPGPRLAKRCIDVALTIIGTLFIFPFLALIALLIKLDSKGPVFYTQKRLGKDGTYFSAYKFRTMHGDGEARLKAILDADPALRAEYDIYHKLRKDPRVTRIGRILRKFSLDEFPQLLNVIRGEMSLVGPRPYIERELTEMSGQEKIILRAPPGMTGMWQVSDRNATSFAQRVQIDVYYVRNWSPWLDIHILAKTFGVVIKGSGV